MDILYIVGEGCSQCNNNELRYSLRSIEKYGKGVDRIFVAGYCPEWLSDKVIKIPCDDIYSDKENHGNRNANVLNKLIYVVDNSDIGDEFLVSFDDNFYIRDVDFNNYPHYVRITGDTYELPIHREKESSYKKCMANTRDFIKKMNLPTLNFAVHRNLHVKRQDIAELRDTLELIVKNSIECDRFVLLNNHAYKRERFEITPVKDVKLTGGCDWWKVDPNNTECFSTVDFNPGIGLDCLIGGMFNKKSKYEI